MQFSLIELVTMQLAIEKLSNNGWIDVPCGVMSQVGIHRIPSSDIMDELTKEINRVRKEMPDTKYWSIKNKEQIDAI